MTERKRIVVQEKWGLLCPDCGNGNLHQIWVESYFREEDAKVGKFCQASREGYAAFHGLLPDHNPSQRRDGIRIGFTCEHCTDEVESGTFVLAVAQHKGSTLMYWED